MSPASLSTRPARRYASGAAGALLATAVLTGCGGVGGDSDEDAAALEVFGFGTPDEIASSRLDTFRAAHPDIELNLPEGAFDEQQFLSSIASDTPPDLVYLDRTRLPQYAAAGALTPLTDCIADEDVDTDQYRDTAMEQVTVDGEVYGLPEFNNVRVVYVNDRAAQAVGIDPASFSTTDWELLRQQAQAMTTVQGDDLVRIGFDPRLPESLPLWTAANGGALLSPDGLTAQLDSPEVVEALTYALSLADASGGWERIKPARDAQDPFGAENQFVEDQVGALPIESFWANVYADVSPDAPITVVPFTGRDGQPVTEGDGNAWAIPTGAAHPEDACRFAATMTAADTWVDAARDRRDALEAEGGYYLGTYTANEVADATIATEVFEPTGVAWLDRAVSVIQQVQDAAVVQPPSPAGQEVRVAYQDAVNRVLNGEQDPQTALAQGQQEAQDAIDAAR